MTGDLTKTETASLTDCEQVIERGMATFVDVGRALLQIRDKRLYRGTHASFDAYCKERWDFDQELRPPDGQLGQGRGSAGTLVNWQVPPRLPARPRFGR